MKKKYPFVKQNGLKDCAAACTQMILKYYGGYASISKLNDLMNTNSNGTTAYDIIKTLEYLGFKARGIKLKNLKNVTVPCIAHVIIDGVFKHYIVIYEINLQKNYLILADPARGLNKISITSFIKEWSNVIIEMYPVRNIIKDKEPKTWPFLFKYIKFFSKEISFIGVFSFLFTVLSIIGTLLVQQILNLFSESNNLFKIMCLFLVLYIVKSIIEFVKNKFTIRVCNKLDKCLTRDVFEKIVYLPYNFYRNRTTGEINSSFNDLSMIRQMLVLFISVVFIDLPILLLSGILLLFFDFKLFLIIVLFVTLNFIYWKFYNRKNKNGLENFLYQKALVNSYMIEVINGFETIKNLNVDKKVLKNFDERYELFLRANYKMEILYNKELFWQNMIYILEIFIFVMVSSYLNITLELFVTTFVLMNMFISSFKNILNFNLNFEEFSVTVKRIIELLDFNSVKKIRKRINGIINFENVSYSFDKFVLSNINFKIKRGSKVMVIGESGSGKSTLFKMLKGFYDDYHGNIKINNKNIRNYDLINVVYISQNEILFTDTLNNNLNLRRKCNKNNIKICDINNMFYDNFLIEENGFNLSSGEKQRIILARALNDFDILIIDEALNAVDTNMERRIIKNIFDYYRGKTIIYISHRLDNKDLFDQLVKLEKGKVVLNELRSRRFYENK